MTNTETEDFSIESFLISTFRGCIDIPQAGTLFIFDEVPVGVLKGDYITWFQQNYQDKIISAPYFFDFQHIQILVIDRTEQRAALAQFYDEHLQLLKEIDELRTSDQECEHIV